MRPSTFLPSLILAATFVVSAPAIAAQGKKDILLNLPEGSGISTTVQYTHKKTFKNEVTTQGYNAIYDYDLKPQDDDFLVTRTVRSISFQGFDIDKGNITGELPKVLTKYSSALKATFVSDYSLTPMQLENWADVKADIRQGFLNDLGPTGAKLFDQTYLAMSNDDFLRILLPSEAYSAMAKNLSLTLNEPLVVKSALPAPITGTPIDAEERLGLVSYDTDKKLAQVEYYFGPTSESAKNYLQILLPKFLRSAGEMDMTDAQLAEMIHRSKFDLSTRCTFQIELVYGLLKQGECTRTIDISFPGYVSFIEDKWVISESLH